MFFDLGYPSPRTHTHIHAYPNTLSREGLERDTEWRTPIAYLKLRVFFRKRATNYRALLWTTTYNDKASYDSTPP